MSGGGARPSRGAMRLRKRGNSAPAEAAEFVTDEMVASQQSAVAEIEAKCQVAGSEVSQFEVQLAELEKATSRLRTDLKKSELDRNARASSVQQLETALRGSSSSSKSQRSEADDNERQRQLEVERTAAERELALKQQAASGVKRHVAELEQALMDAGGAEVRRQRQKVDTIREQLSALQTRIAKMTVTEETQQAKLIDLRKEIEESERQQKSCTERIAQLQQSIEKMEEDAAEMLSRYEVADEQFKRYDADLDAISASFDAKKKEFAKVRSAEVDLTNRIEDLAKSQRELQVCLIVVHQPCMLTFSLSESCQLAVPAIEDSRSEGSSCS